MPAPKVRDLVWRIVNEWADQEQRRLEERGDGWSLPGYLASLSATLGTAALNNFHRAFTQRITRCCTLSQQEYILLTDSLQKDWEQVKGFVLLSLAAARGRMEEPASSEA